MTKYVMRSAQAVLPGALVEYLFDLALLNPGTDVQTFRMEPERVNGKNALKVEHTIYRSEYLEEHRLFGHEPICATVSVCYDGIGYNMSLADYQVPGNGNGAAAGGRLQYQTSAI